MIGEKFNNLKNNNYIIILLCGNLY